MVSRNWDLLRRHYEARGIPEWMIRQECITQQDAETLEVLTHDMRPLRLLEVGSSIGMSLGVLAMGSPDSANLVSVDLNIPLSVSLCPGTNPRYVMPCDVLAEMLHTFGLEQRVHTLVGCFSTPVSRSDRKRSTAAGFDVTMLPTVGLLAKQRGPFDFVFLDGDHAATTVLQDLSVIFTMLTPRGSVAIHDITGGWGPSVGEGVDQFLASHREVTFDRILGIGILARKSGSPPGLRFGECQTLK